MGSSDYWEQEVETLSRDKLEKLQLERLKKTLVDTYSTVDFYRKRLDDAGIDPEKFDSLDELEKIPFTVKDDLRNNFPFGLFARPMKEVVRIHSSSGTTGNPTVVGYTKNDIAMWANLIARQLYATGVRDDDVIQNSYGYGLFTGGLGLHYGGELLGATVVPVSGGNTQRQIKIMQDYSSTVICCTPSYALYMAEVGKELGIDFEDLPLKIGIMGAEPWTEEIRREIEERLQIEAIDIYGLSEIIGPGVSCECNRKAGLHIAEDHFIIEIIDPETGKRKKPGEIGEMVFTSITKEAFPIIRYRTRDLSKIDIAKCGCGRTHTRMAKPMGRADDMLIIRGVNVFPSQIEEVLMQVRDVEPHYLIVVDSKNYLDTLEVWVEVSEDIFSEKMNDLENFESAIEHKLYSTTGIKIDVKLKEPRAIKRSMGKAKRVLDKRKGETI
ncbi:MAG TPA: phenylacetate--CoA ligase [Actinobacteria bacterium]|nr:phenylacetate--CoA ligase [Actinomycetota bacterium]